MIQSGGLGEILVCSSAGENNDALLLSIQHPALYNNQRAIATMLCINRRLTLDLLRTFCGSVPVLCRLKGVQDAQLLSNWFAANGSLVKSLDIGFSPAADKTAMYAQRATVVLAQAVGKALKATPGLLLRHVVLDELATEAVPELLYQLGHCRYLTKLELILPRPSSRASSSGALEKCDVSHSLPAAHMYSALAGLSGLRSLLLHSRCHNSQSSTDVLLPALHALHQLTFLSIDEPLASDGISCATVLQGLVPKLVWLPKQLLHLNVNIETQPRGKCYEGIGNRPPMNLSHLTALTAITYGKPCIGDAQAGHSKGVTPHNTGNSSPIVTAFDDLDAAAPGFMHLLPDDQLPATLQQVFTGLVSSVKPILRLQQLQQLEVAGTNLKQEFLQLLVVHCQQLTSLKLSYHTATPALLEPASTAWPSLPLTALRLRCCALSSVLMQQLVLVSTLVTLQLELFNQDMVLLPFALIPLHLTSLQRLAILVITAPHLLASDDFDQLGDLNASQYQSVVDLQQDHCQQLFLSVTGCKQLRCFSFESSGMRDDDFHLDCEALAGATQLTALRLRNLGLQDSSMLTLATGNLIGLKELDVSDNKQLSSKALMAIARGLKQLTYLDLRHTAVNQITATWATRQVALPSLCVLQVSKPAAAQEIDDQSDITFACWAPGPLWNDDEGSDQEQVGEQ